MSRRSRHAHKEIEDAVVEAEARGWRVIEGRNHAKFKLLCPYADRSGCMILVWSTPKNPGNHALDIIRALHKCECGTDHDGF